jgi:hypothetical protein
LAAILQWKYGPELRCRPYSRRMQHRPKKNHWLNRCLCFARRHIRWNCLKFRNHYCCRDLHLAQLLPQPRFRRLILKCDRLNRKFPHP